MSVKTQQFFTQIQFRGTCFDSLLSHLPTLQRTDPRYSKFLVHLWIPKYTKNIYYLGSVLWRSWRWSIRVETCRPKIVCYVINCCVLTDILYFVGIESCSYDTLTLTSMSTSPTSEDMRLHNRKWPSLSILKNSSVIHRLGCSLGPTAVLNAFKIKIFPAGNSILIPGLFTDWVISAV